MKKSKKTLHSIGEFGLIDFIRKKVHSPKDYPVFVDIGDDAFVADIRKGYSLVATKDMLIENVHFKKLWATPFEIGYKSIAVNLSDLAAMGASKPLYCLVGLGLPAKTTIEFVDKLYTGMIFASKKHNLKIVGGDTVSTKKDIVISITLVGEIDPKYVLKRSCAKVGDVLVVNASFGDSGAGLFLLKKGLKGASKDEKYLIKKHLLPMPRLKEASLLAHSGKITSLIDSSDGLAASVKFITEESKVGAKIYLEEIPISNQLKKMCKINKRLNPYDFALNGGEDYELVYTASPKDLSALRKIMPSIQVIGEITFGKSVKYYLNGKERKIKKTGFQHFE